MKLNEEERQIMVNLEYEKAQSFLEQYFTQCQPF